MNGHNDITIEEGSTNVYADLGYADTSTFYRAFVSWSGVSPERFRAQLAQREPKPSRVGDDEDRAPG